MFFNNHVLITTNVLYTLVCSNTDIPDVRTWREGNGVLLYGYVLEGLHLYGCVIRECTTIWVCY